MGRIVSFYPSKSNKHGLIFEPPDSTIYVFDRKPLKDIVFSNLYIKQTVNPCRKIVIYFYTKACSRAHCFLVAGTNKTGIGR